MSCLFMLRHFAAQNLRSFDKGKRKNEQIPAKDRPFLIVSIR